MRHGGPLQRRTPLKARTGLRRSGPLRSRSCLTRRTPLRPRRAQLVVTVQLGQPISRVLTGKRRWGRYTGPSRKVRAVVRARSGGWCELRLPGCWGRSSELSHRLGKKAGGRHGRAALQRVNGAAAVLDACTPCHGQITSPHGPVLRDARARGLLLTEDQDPTAVPVISPAWPGPALLDNDGGWRLA